MHVGRTNSKCFEGLAPNTACDFGLELPFSISVIFWAIRNVIPRNPYQFGIGPEGGRAAAIGGVESS